MTQDEIDDLSKQARNIWSESKTTEGMSFFLRTFAELVDAKAIAKEREACAKLCDAEAEFSGSNGKKDASASNCADAIRARGET